MSSYVLHINAFRALRKGYFFLGSLQTPKVMFYNHSTCMNSFICKESIKSSCHKYYSTLRNPKGGFPNITDFPINILPNFMNAFKNFYMTNFVLRRYFDEEFDLKEFIKGSKTAVEVVTRHLSAGTLNELSDLVTPDVLEQLKVNIRKFSLKQKLDLAIDQRDIFACYTHDISIIKTNEEENRPKWEISDVPNGRSVEITVTYHVVKGFRVSGDQSHQPMTSPDFNKNLFVLTYRFIRDFNQDKSSWIINGLNHFKPLEETE